MTKVDINNLPYNYDFKYDNKCIYCSSIKTYPLFNDGGSRRKCMLCNQTFTSRIVIFQQSATLHMLCAE